MKQLLLTAALVLSAASCTKNYYAPTSPDAVPLPSDPLPGHKIEFRVESVLSSGIQQAQITYGTGLDGTSSISTDLPWNAVTTCTESSLYVYIQAVSIGLLEVRLQIFVDGRLFKEVTGFAPSVSGTIRL